MKTSDPKTHEQITVAWENLVPRYTRENDPNKMTDSEFSALKALMSAEGSLETILITPEKGKKGKYIIINGHHRYWASEEIGKIPLPAMVIPASAVKQALLSIGMNRIRGDLDLARAGTVIQEAMDASNMGIDQAALYSGLSTEEIEALTQQAGEDADDLLEELGTEMSGTQEDEGETNPKPYVLEITFADKDTYRLARRKLKKAAGKGGDLARGLLSLLGEEDAAAE